MMMRMPSVRFWGPPSSVCCVSVMDNQECKKQDDDEEKKGKGQMVMQQGDSYSPLLLVSHTGIPREDEMDGRLDTRNQRGEEREEKCSHRDPRTLE